MVKVLKVDGNGTGALEVGAFGFHIKITGRLARYALVVVFVLGSLYYAGFSRPQEILNVIKDVKRNTTRTNVMVGAIIKSMPTQQAKRAKEAIDADMLIFDKASGQ